MKVVLRDHDYIPNRSLSAWAEAVRAQFPDVDIGNPDSGRDRAYPNTLVILHTQTFGSGSPFDVWRAKVAGADGAELLLVSSLPPVSRAKGVTDPKVHYCDWTPRSFGGAQEEPIRRFIESVKTGSPEWSLLSACAALSALSILCQGYLAVRASHLAKNGNITEAENTRRVLGFQSLESGETLLASFGSEDNWARVQQPKWWLSVFGPDSEEAGKALVDAVEFEWPKAEADVKRLVNALTRASEHTVQEEVVKAAFAAIGRRMEMFSESP